MTRQFRNLEKAVQFRPEALRGTRIDSDEVHTLMHVDGSIHPRYRPTSIEGDAPTLYVGDGPFESDVGLLIVPGWLSGLSACPLSRVRQVRLLPLELGCAHPYRARLNAMGCLPLSGPRSNPDRGQLSSSSSPAKDAALSRRRREFESRRGRLETFPFARIGYQLGRRPFTAQNPGRHRVRVRTRS